MKKTFKKTLVSIACIVLLVACFAIPAAAASYPTVFLDTKLWGADAKVYAGDNVGLEFTYFPEYKNERLVVEIYDSNGNLKANSDRTFYHSSSMMTYTVWWNTSGYAVGNYKVVVSKYFYTYYSWHETPTKSTYWIELKDPNYKPAQGWKEENGSWYYYEDGVKVKNDWRKDYNGWCFLDENGKWVKNAFVKDSTGKWAYISSDGYFYESTKWIQYGSNWYYLEKGYRVENDWRKDYNGWCFLDENGKWVKNTFVKDSTGKWAYISSNGYYYESTKWVQYGSDWYYLEKGYRVENDWRKDYNGWCYLDSNGIMVKNQWVTDSSGYWCWINGAGYWDGNYYTSPVK